MLGWETAMFVTSLLDAGSALVGLCWLFVYKLVPETMGKSIEQIVGELCPHTIVNNASSMGSVKEIVTNEFEEDNKP